MVEPARSVRAQLDGIIANHPDYFANVVITHVEKEGTPEEVVFMEARGQRVLPA